MNNLFNPIKNEPLRYLLLPKFEDRTTYQRLSSKGDKYSIVTTPKKYNSKSVRETCKNF